MSDCNFQDPKNLKEILEELGKLDYATETRHKVFEQLKNGLKAYCAETYLQAFYGGRDYGRGYSGSILLLTKAGEKVSEAILLKASWTSGTYKNLDNDHASHSNCAEKISEALKKCLPKAYAALYFLLFMGDKSLGGIQGGQWKDQNVNGSDRSGTDLFNWLTKEEKSVGGGSSKPLTPGLIKRGFLDSELKNSNGQGSTVATAIQTIITHNTPGYLQKALCGFMFVFPWDDALTGHTCLFLSKFCEKVNEDPKNAFNEIFQRKYADNNYDTFKELCQQLKPNLDPFIDGTTSGLQAVCQQNQNLFKDIWKEDAFEKYCEWLSTNLGQIIESLASMSKDSDKWSSSSLTNASSAGPFKYGFVFKDKGWESKINSKLKSLIEVLTGQESGSLIKLKECLRGPETQAARTQVSHDAGHSQAQSSNNSGVTAAGASVGVLSLGGAGV
ncbi:secreted antigen 1, partial [Babesia divergens]